MPGLSYLVMQDASDILAGHVGKDTTRAGAEDPSPRVPERPAGISRELYSLLSDEALPSLIPSKAPGPTSFRDRKKGGVKWEWKPFSSSARKDKCQLKHWWKKHENPEDYSFARFNKKARLIAPTKTEYDQLLKDPNWTPQESAYLLKVAAKYALRWHVIFDRYYIESKDTKVSPRGGRTVEDLKHRYYNMTKAVNPQLMPYQFLVDDGTATGQGAVRRVEGYDPVYERNRKDKLNTFYTRSGQQESGDIELAEQAKAIEDERKKRAADGNENGGGWARAITRADVEGVELCEEALLRSLGGEMKRAVTIRRKLMPEPPESCMRKEETADGRPSRKPGPIDKVLGTIGIDTADPVASLDMPGVDPGLPLMATVGISSQLYQLRGHLLIHAELHEKLQNAVRVASSLY